MLIVTLELDATSQQWFEQLRRRYFPPERNHIPAHLTLFHAIPDDREVELGEAIAVQCERVKFELSVSRVRSLGRGVAFDLVSAELQMVRGELTTHFADALGAQDRQRFQPHITVQNKVDPAVARETLATLQQLAPPHPIAAEALCLWRYLGGPWKALDRKAFAR